MVAKPAANARQVLALAVGYLLLLAAAEALVKEGFTVLPYINADPVLAKRLQEVGAATVMPLGSPIGSNRGIQTRDQIRIIIEQATVPVVVDAGLGAPSHAAEAMEMGADAVLINTAIAVTEDPIRMAIAASVIEGIGHATRFLQLLPGARLLEKGDLEFLEHPADLDRLLRVVHGDVAARLRAERLRGVRGQGHVGRYRGAVGTRRGPTAAARAS